MYYQKVLKWKETKKTKNKKQSKGSITKDIRNIWLKNKIKQSKTQ